MDMTPVVTPSQTSASGVATASGRAASRETPTSAGDLFATLINRPRTGEAAISVATPNMEAAIFANPVTVDPPAPPRDTGHEDRVAREPAEEPRRAEADSDPADDTETTRADDDARDGETGDNGRDRTTEDGQSRRTDDEGAAQAGQAKASDSRPGQSAHAAAQAAQAAAAALKAAGAGSAGAKANAASAQASATAAKAGTETAATANTTAGDATTRAAAQAVGAAGKGAVAQSATANTQAAGDADATGPAQPASARTEQTPAQARAQAAAQANAGAKAETGAARSDAARAQGEAMADKIKPDAPIQARVTVTGPNTGAEARAHAAQAGQAGQQAQTNAAQGQAMAETGQSQTTRVGAEAHSHATASPSLRQQALEGLRQAQADSFAETSANHAKGKADGTGKGEPSLAQQAAAAAEARTARQAQAAPGRAGDPTAPQAGGRTAAVAPGGAERGPAAQAGQNGGQAGFGQGQQGAGARAATTPTPTPTTTGAPSGAAGGEGAPASGSFADQVARTGQGAAADPSRPQPQARQAVEQVRVNISKAANRGMDRISIQLHPKSLGRVEVKLEFSQDGRVSAQIVADKADTLDMLQRDARGLERALTDAGLKTDSNGLQFSLRGDGAGTQTAQDGTEGRNAGRSDANGQGGAGGEGDADPEAEAREQEARRQAAHAARGGKHTILV